VTVLEQIAFDFLYPQGTKYRDARPLEHIGYMVRWVRHCVDSYTSGEWRKLDAGGLAWLEDMRTVLDLPPIHFAEKKEEVIP
jgi:hypothetical protein